MKIARLSPEQKQRLFDRLVTGTHLIAAEFASPQDAYELMLDIDRAICIAVGADLGDLAEPDDLEEADGTATRYLRTYLRRPVRQSVRGWAG